MKELVQEIIPTEKEVETWLLSTLKHCFHVEYFLDKTKIGNYDPERPHDITGVGNKYDWDVIKGFALQYRKPEKNFKELILKAREIHRQQYHHKIWNGKERKQEDLTDKIRDSLLLGGVDSVCSLRENREYQNGTHGYYEILQIANKNPPHKTPWIIEAVSNMRWIKDPDLNLIVSLNNFKNIGLPEHRYEFIINRLKETLENLKKEHGYSFKI